MKTFQVVNMIRTMIAIIIPSTLLPVSASDFPKPPNDTNANSRPKKILEYIENQPHLREIIKAFPTLVTLIQNH